MLLEPKIRIFNEMSDIILEVEDEGTQIKVDITEKVLSLIDEIVVEEDENEERLLTIEDFGV